MSPARNRKPVVHGRDHAPGGSDPIPGGTGGHVIEDEGLVLPGQPNLNFVGAGVTASDDPANSATRVTITSGGDITGLEWWRFKTFRGSGNQAVSPYVGVSVAWESFAIQGYDPRSEVAATCYPVTAPLKPLTNGIFQFFGNAFVGGGGGAAAVGACAVDCYVTVGAGDGGTAGNLGYQRVGWLQLDSAAGIASGSFAGGLLISANVPGNTRIYFMVSGGISTALVGMTVTVVKIGP